MPDPAGGFTPYDLSYSGRVIEELADLIARAKVHGRDQPLVAAAKTIDDRLRVYPQFGEPFRDLTVESGQEWVAVVSPLIVRYAIFEGRRLVLVVAPIRPLSRSGY
jgi:hypothetical protein